MSLALFSDFDFKFIHSHNYTNLSLLPYSSNSIRELEMKMLRTKQGGAAVPLLCNHGPRWMVTKAANRAAVHGSKLPLPDIIPKEEVKSEIERAVEEKERRRREIENSVDSHLKNWQVLYVDDIVCSK